MIIKQIDKYNFIIKDINIINNIYDQNEIKQLISKIINKLKKKYQLYNSFIFIFYIDEYNNNIIKIKNIENNNKYIDIKLKFYLNNIILYKIDYFLIDKLNINNKNIYYYNNNYYLKINRDITKQQLIFLEENTKYYYSKESLNIINKAIRLKT